MTSLAVGRCPAVVETGEAASADCDGYAESRVPRVHGMGPMGCLQGPKFARLEALHKRAGASRLRAILDDDRGAVMVMFAAISPIILGVAGLAVEASYWQLHQRAMQNAADSAAIAAGMEGGTNYAAVVARAVAAQYGFVDGVGNVTVAVPPNTTPAAGCTSNCYSVSISDKVPLFLSAVVGYQGTSTVSSKPMTSVLAAAVATRSRAAARPASRATAPRRRTCKAATSCPTPALPATATI